MRGSIKARVSAGIIAVLLLSLTGCTVSYNETDYGAYKICSPSYRADSKIGSFSIQQAGSGKSLQWGAYPYSEFKGTWYNLTVYADGVKIDSNSQAYAPHGSVGEDKARKYRGKKLQISGAITRDKDEIRFTIGCVIQ